MATHGYRGSKVVLDAMIISVFGLSGPMFGILAPSTKLLLKCWNYYVQREMCAIAVTRSPCRARSYNVVVCVYDTTVSKKISQDALTTKVFQGAAI
jgi:hypothetical protein